jgi:lipopolysaccharide/colanic/teichoic acid biosynthesis glycosyltransferase
VKRVFDVVVATTTLTICGPLLLALVAAVKLDSNGPALFAQTRVGRGRRPFKLYKLRTMSTSSASASPEITASADPRITRVGSLLRKAKLDELPQLYNVLRGEMSIVGPRPEVPRYVARYRPEWLPLLEVRPGLTDLASLTFREEERLLGMARDRERAYLEVVMPMKLAVALMGLQRRSLSADVHILLRTVFAVLRPRRLGEDPVTREAIRRIEALNDEAVN